MSVSNIQSNLSALLNKAYNTDSSATSASDAISQLVKETSSSTDNSAAASASSLVTLGGADTTTGTYTAKGLMQQLRQYQLSNASLLFGNSDDSSQDNTGLTGLMGTSSDTDLASMSEDWVSTISENPGKASVMVASTQNDTLKTILGNN
ncbi:MAG TPA: hypothetical protein VNZ84_00750 [Methylophilus sp.]|nr:hypothetical protein [Methylophilus sp.]